MCSFSYCERTIQTWFRIFRRLLWVRKLRVFPAGRAWLRWVLRFGADGCREGVAAASPAGVSDVVAEIRRCDDGGWILTDRRVCAVFGLFALVVSIFGIPAACFAQAHDPLAPFKSDFGEKVVRGEDRLRLHVPASFEGRTAKEWRKHYGVELFRGARFERFDSRVEMRGRVSIFDFEYIKDKLDVQVYRSRATRPGKNSCMACHGGDFPRTTLMVGQETVEIVADPVQQGNLIFTVHDAHVTSGHVGINHWISHRLMLRGDYKVGKIRQSDIALDAQAATICVSGIMGHRLVWNSDLIVSKTESYPMKKTFTASLAYRFGKRLRLTFGGGAFLDGYTHFGTEMSEMGVISTTLEKKEPERLPSLFNRVKDDQFGYWLAALEYEYPF